jgi:hypothetical protein
MGRGFYIATRDLALRDSVMKTNLGYGAGSHSHETNGRREAGENLIGPEGR